MCSLFAYDGWRAPCAMLLDDAGAGHPLWAKSAAKAGSRGDHKPAQEGARAVERVLCVYLQFAHAHVCEGNGLLCACPPERTQRTSGIFNIMEASAAASASLSGPDSTSLSQHRWWSPSLVPLPLCPECAACAMKAGVGWMLVGAIFGPMRPVTGLECWLACLYVPEWLARRLGDCLHKRNIRRAVCSTANHVVWLYCIRQGLHGGALQLANVLVRAYNTMEPGISTLTVT